jgi:ATP-dependent Clp protease ATP-binding subunit ClpA
MFERFAAHARDAVSRAIEDAGRRGDRKVATDHLLIGILWDPAIAAEIGTSLEATRRAVDQLDRDALSAVGVDTAAFGQLVAAAGAVRLPFTPGAKAVLKRTLAHAAAEKSRRIETRHMLQALRERRAPDPAAELLAVLLPSTEAGTAADER